MVVREFNKEEIIELETAVELINNTKSCLTEKTNKIDKSLASLIFLKRNKAKDTNLSLSSIDFTSYISLESVYITTTPGPSY